jgi:hypothetical protein
VSGDLLNDWARSRGSFALIPPMLLPIVDPELLLDKRTDI